MLRCCPSNCRKMGGFKTTRSAPFSQSREDKVLAKNPRAAMGEGYKTHGN